VKTVFVKGNWFATLERLELEFMNYVNWFNSSRIHSSLGYMSPIEYRNDTLKKVVQSSVAYPTLHTVTVI